MRMPPDTGAIGFLRRPFDADVIGECSPRLEIALLSTESRSAKHMLSNLSPPEYVAPQWGISLIDRHGVTGSCTLPEGIPGSCRSWRSRNDLRDRRVSGALAEYWIKFGRGAYDCPCPYRRAKRGDTGKGYRTPFTPTATAAMPLIKLNCRGNPSGLGESVSLVPKGRVNGAVTQVGRFSGRRTAALFSG